MHLTRNYAPKTWPVPRKGTKYLVVPSHGINSTIPILIILRELMNVAQNRKEAKKILDTGNIKVNERIIRKENYPVALFDVLALGEKRFRVVLKNKKFNIEEAAKNESGMKIAKIIGRKILKGKKQQINFNDGRNVLSNEKLRIGDSAIINLKENTIEKIIPLKEKSRALIIGGKHKSKEGDVEKIDEKKKLGIVIVGGEKLNVKLESLMAIK